MMQNQTKPTTTLTTTMIKRKEIMDQPSFLFLWITYSYASFWLSLSSLFSRLLVSNFLSLSSEDPTLSGNSPKPHLSPFLLLSGNSPKLELLIVCFLFIFSGFYLEKLITS
jgi:hypothetical protein